MDSLTVKAEAPVMPCLETHCWGLLVHGIGVGRVLLDEMTTSLTRYCMVRCYTSSSLVDSLETLLDPLDPEEGWCQGCWFESMVVEMYFRSYKECQIKERMCNLVEAGWGNFDLMCERESKRML